MDILTLGKDLRWVSLLHYLMRQRIFRRIHGKKTLKEHTWINR